MQDSNPLTIGKWLTENFANAECIEGIDWAMDRKFSGTKPVLVRNTSVGLCEALFAFPQKIGMSTYLPAVYLVRDDTAGMEWAANFDKDNQWKAGKQWTPRPSPKLRIVQSG